MKDADHEKILKKLEGEIAALAAAVPLYRESISHKTTRFAGSGWFLGVAESVFLVSASHVLKRLQGTDVEVRVGLPNKMALLRLTGNAKMFGEPADVGIVQLDDAGLEHVRGLRVLRVPDLDQSRDSDTSLWVEGFPAERNTGEPRGFRAIGYLTTRPINIPKGLQNYDSELNGLYEIDHNDPTSDCSDDPWLPDSFDGMSGCPVWTLPKNLEMGGSGGPSLQLSGVQTSVYPKQQGQQLGKFTHVSVVINLLILMRPDLRQSLSIEFPALRGPVR